MVDGPARNGAKLDIGSTDLRCSVFFWGVVGL